MYRVRNINNLRTTKAFTVIELIIVVVVIAILAALVTVAYQGITEDTRDTSAKSTAEQISKKLEVYMTQNAGLPDDLSEVGFSDNNDTTYYYEKVGSTYFCASVTVGESSYYVTYDESQAQDGTCDDAGTGGGTTLPPRVGERLFTEGAGTTAADSSGNGYTLSRIGGSNAVWVAAGHSGAGFKPTASRYFERASFGSEVLKTWTVTLWYKREGNTTAQGGQFLHDGSDFWMETNQAGNWGFEGNYSDNTLPLNTWTHLAWVLVQTSETTGTMRFYQNGTLQFSEPMTTGSSYMHYSRTWRFGSGGDGPLNGTLDSYRIYAEPLNASQIAADMALN